MGDFDRENEGLVITDHRQKVEEPPFGVVTQHDWLFPSGLLGQRNRFAHVFPLRSGPGTASANDPGLRYDPGQLLQVLLDVL